VPNPLDGRWNQSHQLLLFAQSRIYETVDLVGNLVSVSCHLPAYTPALGLESRYEKRRRVTRPEMWRRVPDHVDVAILGDVEVVTSRRLHRLRWKDPKHDRHRRWTAPRSEPGQFWSSEIRTSLSDGSSPQLERSVRPSRHRVCRRVRCSFARAPGWAESVGEQSEESR
jgi:hypothetical protein